jgi:hypothetical protein
VKGIKKPLFLLGIPFLMFMSESIFFDGVKLFKIPGSLFFCLPFIWLVLLWIVSMFIQNIKEKSDLDNRRTLNVLDFFIIGLLIISFVGLGLTLINFSIITDVFKEFIILISLFAGYFIIRTWFSNNKPDLWVSFLNSLVIINTIASFLYILHQGLHINIYNLEEHSTELFQGEEITRTFYFMPQLLPFSIVFILVFKDKRSFTFYLLLLVNLLAVFISYTRSSIIIAAIIFLFYFLLTGLKKGRIGLVLKNVFLFLFVGVIGLLILSKILPANTKYFMNRFSELSETSATSGPNNIEYRFLMTRIIISNIEEDKKILGMGPVTENQLPLVRPMRQATSDMVWAGVIFRWGFAGFIFFILLYSFSVVKAYYFFMNANGVLSDLALMLLLFIISQIIESFVSWTFMSGHGFTTGLWYFALLSALLGFNKKNELLVD